MKSGQVSEIFDDVLSMAQEIRRYKARNDDRRKEAMKWSAQEIDFKELNTETKERLKALGYIK